MTTIMLPQEDFVVIAAEIKKDKDAAKDLCKKLQSAEDDVTGIYYTDNYVKTEMGLKQVASLEVETIAQNFERATYKLVFVTKDLLACPSTQHHTYSLIDDLIKSRTHDKTCRTGRPDHAVLMVWAEPKRDLDIHLCDNIKDPTNRAFAKSVLGFNGYDLQIEEEMCELRDILKGAKNKKIQRCREQQERHEQLKEERELEKRRREATLLEFPDSEKWLAFTLKHVTEKDAEKTLNKKGVYPMKKETRGRLLIINNIEFSNHVKKDKRAFASFDEENLRNLFTQLHFDVPCIEKNLTADEMKQCILEESRRDHSADDAFFLCIMSHGSEENVLGTDGEMILVEKDIVKPFSKMNVGEPRRFPKVLIIQACREDSQNDAQGKKDQPTDSDAQGKEDQPTDSDAEGKEDQPRDSDAEGKEDQPRDSDSQRKEEADGASGDSPESANGRMQKFYDDSRDHDWRQNMVQHVDPTAGNWRQPVNRDLRPNDYGRRGGWYQDRPADSQYNKSRNSKRGQYRERDRAGLDDRKDAYRRNDSGCTGYRGSSNSRECYEQEPPPGRQKLNLKPRSDRKGASEGPSAQRRSDIYGNATPVDTTKRDREIEERNTKQQQQQQQQERYQPPRKSSAGSDRGLSRGESSSSAPHSASTQRSDCQPSASSSSEQENAQKGLDILLVQSTLPGELAYAEEVGSWFIREFVRFVASYAHVADLQTILKWMNEEMIKRDAIRLAPSDNKRQCCEVRDRGFGILHFLPGYKG